MINKTKLEAINTCVETIRQIDCTLGYTGRSHYTLVCAGQNTDIPNELIDNALSTYKETLTLKLKQLGYEENYVEVTTRG